MSSPHSAAPPDGRAPGAPSSDTLPAGAPALPTPPAAPDAAAPPHGHPGWADRHRDTRRVIESEEDLAHPGEPRPELPASSDVAPPPPIHGELPAPAAPLVVPDATPAPAPFDQPGAPAAAPDASVPAAPAPVDVPAPPDPVGDPLARPIGRLLHVARLARRGSRTALVCGGATAATGFTAALGAAVATATPTASAGTASVVAWAQLAAQTAAAMWPGPWMVVAVASCAAAMCAAAVAGGAAERAEVLARRRSADLAHRARVQRWRQRQAARLRAEREAEMLRARADVVRAETIAQRAEELHRAIAEHEAGAAQREETAMRDVEREEYERRVERAILTGRPQ